MNPLLIGILAIVGYVFWKNTPSGKAATQKSTQAATAQANPYTTLATTVGTAAATKVGTLITDALHDSSASGSSQQTTNRPPVGGQGDPSNSSSSGADGMHDAAAWDGANEADSGNVDDGGDPGAGDGQG